MYIYRGALDISSQSNLIWTPSLEFENVLQYQSTQAYGASFKFSLWYNIEKGNLEYEEEIQLSLLCPFEFSDFPFDSHECYVEYGDDKYGASKLILNPANIAYRNLKIRFGDDPLLIDHLPSPYKFELAPLPSKEIMYDELYSYTGMILKLERNSLGKLLSGFYYPTTAFAILSLISYLINPDVVSFDNILLNKNSKNYVCFYEIHIL